MPRAISPGGARACRLPAGPDALSLPQPAPSPPEEDRRPQLLRALRRGWSRRGPAPPPPGPSHPPVLWQGPPRRLSWPPPGLTIWSASISTVLTENLRLQKLNRSSRLGPSRSMTITLYSPSTPYHRRLGIPAVGARARACKRSTRRHHQAYVRDTRHMPSPGTQGVQGPRGPGRRRGREHRPASRPPPARASPPPCRILYSLDS